MIHECPKIRFAQTEFLQKEFFVSIQQFFSFIRRFFHGFKRCIDAKLDVLRLAAARREALEALIGDLRRRNSDTQTQLTEAEAGRLADAAAAQALRDRLAKSGAELDAATLELEAARKKSEETLTLLAAAEAAKKDLGAQNQMQVDEATKQAALLALAEQKLSEQQALSVEDQRRVTALNLQVAQLNNQLGSLRAVLDEYIAVQMFNADRPESFNNLGTLYADQGDMVRAEQALHKGLEIDPARLPRGCPELVLDVALATMSAQRPIDAEATARFRLLEELVLAREACTI